MQRFWIPGPLPGMNEILSARGRTGKQIGSKRWNAYNRMKGDIELVVKLKAREWGVQPVKSTRLTFLHAERDRRRDPDNFASGAQKLIIDGLRLAEILPNDGWKHVKGIAHYWTVDEFDPGCMVFLGDKVLSEDEAFELYNERRERS